jgi:hypothetical protein
VIVIDIIAAVSSVAVVVVVLLLLMLLPLPPPPLPLLLPLPLSLSSSLSLILSLSSSLHHSCCSVISVTRLIVMFAIITPITTDDSLHHLLWRQSQRLCQWQSWHPSLP